MKKSKIFYEFYDHMGWSLFPIYQFNGKRTYPKGWNKSENQYKNVRSLLNDNPYVTMYGIPMEQNNLLVIDCDTDDDGNPLGETEFKKLVNDNGSELPETLVVRSKSGGLHYYFSVDYSDKENCYTNSVKELCPHVDVRGKGGMIVAPASYTQDGKIYRIDHFPKDLIIPELPNWLASLLKRSQKEPENYAFHSAFTSCNPKAYRVFDSYIEKLKKAQKGERNCLLNKCAGQVFRLSPQYLSSAEIWNSFSLVGKQLGLSETEIKATLRSAERFGTSHQRYLG